MCDNECPICRETLHGFFSVGCTVPCGHVFHRTCYETWELHSTANRCPCCNMELTTFIDKIHIHLPPLPTQQEQDEALDSEHERKIRRRAELSMGKAQCARSHGNNKQEITESQKGNNYRNKSEDEKNTDRRNDREEMMETTIEDGKEMSMSCQREGATGAAVIAESNHTSISRTMQRTIPKYPYGKKDARKNTNKSNNPKIWCASSTKDLYRNGSEPDSFDMMMRGFEDEIPDVADRIMQEIERSMRLSRTAS